MGEVRDLELTSGCLCVCIVQSLKKKKSTVNTLGGQLLDLGQARPLFLRDANRLPIWMRAQKM